MTTMLKTKALAPWFGSNRLLGEYVGQALSGCHWVCVAFVGGFSELAHIEARTLWVNDKHRHVINLASVAADRRLGPQLWRRLRRLAFHPDVLAAAQDRCRRRELNIVPLATDCPLDWAEDYFVCCWMGRSGKAGTKGEFNGQLALRFDGGGGDSVVRFRSAASGIREWNRLLANAQFSTDDAFDVLAKVKDLDGHGVYCDPPFFGPGDTYKFTFKVEHHRRLATQLSIFKRTRVVVRYYDIPLVRELYPEDRGWAWRPLEGRTQANKTAPEVLIANMPLFITDEPPAKKARKKRQSA